jgi:ribosomal protein S18 acetylase RimI-like enzyme
MGIGVTLSMPISIRPMIDSDIGTRLLQYALDYVASHGYSHASILVSARNSAKRIYEKAGFYEDRQIMMKAIKHSSRIGSRNK